MSDRRLLLDGPDLQELLARAAELGGRVVRAERVRKGLLARQWYELTVEVPELSGPPVPAPPVRAAAPAAAPRPEPATASRRPRPAGISDLIAAAEAAERLETAAAREARATTKRSAK